MGIITIFLMLGGIFLLTLGHSMFRLFWRWPSAGQVGSWQRARFFVGSLVLPAAVAALTVWLYFDLINSDFGE